MLNNTRVIIEVQIPINSSNLLKQYTKMRNLIALYNLFVPLVNNLELLCREDFLLHAFVRRDHCFLKTKKERKF